MKALKVFAGVSQFAPPPPRATDSRATVEKHLPPVHARRRSITGAWGRPTPVGRPSFILGTYLVFDPFRQW